MAEKELRKMNRSELIEIIYALQQNEKTLRRDYEDLQDRLEDKTIRLGQSGSIAEAALSLNHIFEDAESAAQQYLESIKEADASAGERAQELTKEAGRKNAQADALLRQTREECEARLAETDRDCEARLRRTEAECEARLAETDRDCEARLRQTEAECEARLQETASECAGLLAEAKEKAEARMEKVNKKIRQLMRKYPMLKEYLEREYAAEGGGA